LGWTPLHIASHSGFTSFVKYFLEKGADPTIKSPRTACEVAKDKEMRNVFRKFAGKNPGKWNYEFAKIIPLTEEMEQEQKQKNLAKIKERKKRSKQTKKERQKQEEEEREKKAREDEIQSMKEEARLRKLREEAEWFKLSEREKRARAAEMRLKNQIQCSNCLIFFGDVPFERLEYKYCSTACVQAHRKKLEIN